MDNFVPNFFNTLQYVSPDKIQATDDPSGLGQRPPSVEEVAFYRGEHCAKERSGWACVTKVGRIEEQKLVTALFGSLSRCHIISKTSTLGRAIFVICLVQISLGPRTVLGEIMIRMAKGPRASKDAKSIMHVFTVDEAI